MTSSLLARAAFAASLTIGFASLAKAEAPRAAAVLDTYADIAEAGYADSLAAAKSLQAAIGKLLESPAPETLAAARQAWLAARVPYQQTEAYRFGNKIVDDWEGRVNAWPLDEGLIDYVAGAYGGESPENELYAANVIANPSMKAGGKTIDTSKIDKTLLAESLHEAGGVEANVATGYHAIEFLLWGQDLNGTGPGAGNRPATDFDAKNCTGGNCDRRAAYLRAAADLLADDLTWMAARWEKSGAARAALKKGGDTAGLVAIFTGLGGMSYGELAGERMKLGLLIHDPEEEHDCFSDNTHHSHYYDAVGLRNVYLGTLKRIDGTEIKGASVSDLVRAKSPDIDGRVRAALDETVKRMDAIVARAKSGESYDQMIGEGNAEGNAAVQSAIDGLLAQTEELERAIAALDLRAIQFEGSDSLDSPEKVAVP